VDTRSFSPGTGFLIFNSSLQPLYLNTCAAEILFYPHKPPLAEHLFDELAAKIRMMVARSGPDGLISACGEFLSGSRRYICRLVSLEWPYSDTKDASLAILFERRHKAQPGIREICQKHHLTPREARAVELLLEGLANKEIAARMGISPNTLKVFFRLAMVKLGVTSRSALMSKFINGGVTPSE
jgi:DNA-binding NarL/FixJ family response regulator